MILAPRPRSHEAPYGGKKVNPHQARSCKNSIYFTALSHDINCQIEGGAPLT